MKNKIFEISLVALIVLFGIGAFLFLRVGMVKEEVPEISGISNLQIQEGDPLPNLKSHLKALKNISDVSVDATKVNRHKSGSYPVVYSYLDQKGKKQTITVICKVVKRKEKNKKEESRQNATPTVAKQKVPESVKTGDPIRVYGYIVLITISFLFLVECFFCRRNKERKI